MQTSWRLRSLGNRGYYGKKELDQRGYQEAWGIKKDSGRKEGPEDTRQEAEQSRQGDRGQQEDGPKSQVSKDSEKDALARMVLLEQKPILF